MTHDPICRISKAMRNGECCADDPLFGYPCDCRLITEVRQDMLAKCIALCDSHITRINNEAASQDYERFANEFYANADGIEFIVGELRALQEKP